MKAKLVSGETKHVLKLNSQKNQQHQNKKHTEVPVRPQAQKYKNAF